MADVPQKPSEILTAARQRAAVMSSQVSALGDDLLSFAARKGDVPDARGMASIADVTLALQQLAAVIDGGSSDMEQEAGQ